MTTMAIALATELTDLIAAAEQASRVHSNGRG